MQGGGGAKYVWEFQRYFVYSNFPLLITIYYIGLVGEGGWGDIDRIHREHVLYCTVTRIFIVAAGQYCGSITQCPCRAPWTFYEMPDEKPCQMLPPCQKSGHPGSNLASKTQHKSTVEKNHFLTETNLTDQNDLGYYPSSRKLSHDTDPLTLSFKKFLPFNTLSYFAICRFSRNSYPLTLSRTLLSADSQEIPTL